MNVNNYYLIVEIEIKKLRFRYTEYLKTVIHEILHGTRN